MKSTDSEKYDCRNTSLKYLNLLWIVSCLFMNNPVQAEECLLAKQLKNPLVRAEYTEIIVQNRTKSDKSDLESMYGNIQTASFSETTGFSGQNNNNPYDAISMECVACHDGVMAKAVNHRIFDGKRQRVKSMETIKGAHPVGMNYNQYSWNKEYIPEENLPADMVLMGGKVVCVTCHNLLGNNENYLAVDNYKSRLCFSCHVK